MRSPCTAMESSPRSPQLEKTRAQQQRPNAAKINKFIKKKKILHHSVGQADVPRLGKNRLPEASVGELVSFSVNAACNNSALE